MIAHFPVLLSAAPATATLVTGGLEPVFWTTVALVSIAVALIVRDASSTEFRSRVLAALPCATRSDVKLPAASGTRHVRLVKPAHDTAS